MVISHHILCCGGAYKEKIKTCKLSHVYVFFSRVMSNQTWCLLYTVEPLLGDLWFGRPLVLGDHNHWHGSFLTIKYLA